MLHYACLCFYNERFPFGRFVWAPNLAVDVSEGTFLVDTTGVRRNNRSVSEEFCLENGWIRWLYSRLLSRKHFYRRLVVFECTGGCQSRKVRRGARLVSLLFVSVWQKLVCIFLCHVSPECVRHGDVLSKTKDFGGSSISLGKGYERHWLCCCFCVTYLVVWV